MATSNNQRRFREDRSTWPMSTLLPPKNRAAGRGYVCAVAGLIPGLGLLLGPLAIVFGWVGWRRFQRDPAIWGGGHALLSIVLGSLEILVNVVGFGFIAKGVGLI